MKEVKILFVCTGNVFRSMSGDYCLKNYLKKKNIKGFKISSAGTHAKNQKIAKETQKTLLSLGINVKKHKQRRINQKIYNENDLIIAMAEDHKEFIEKRFGKEKVVLFKEILYGKKISLRDLNEEIPNWVEDQKADEEYERYVVKYIHKNIPRLYERLERYILFRRFVLGQGHHINRLPFIPLKETKNTISFMSIDIPHWEDGHVLVIPKKVYLSFNHLTNYLRNELINHVSIITKAITKTHGGFHLLLNDGKAADHSNNHVHFHVIPRNKGDKIKMEGWRKRSLNKKEFLKINEKMKESLK